MKNKMNINFNIKYFLLALLFCSIQSNALYAGCHGWECVEKAGVDALAATEHAITVIVKETKSLIYELVDEDSQGSILNAAPIILHSLIEAGQCVNPVSIAAYPVLVGSYFTYRDKMLDEGHVVSVPPCLYQIIRDDYHLDPVSVNIRMDVTDTPSSDTAITLENTIFFPYDFDVLEDQYSLHWLLHEIEHITQWRDKGVAGFIAEYVCATGVNIEKFDLLEIHDGIQLERAADAKADRLIIKAVEACDVNWW